VSAEAMTLQSVTSEVSQLKIARLLLQYCLTVWAASSTSMHIMVLHLQFGNHCILRTC